MAIGSASYASSYTAATFIAASGMRDAALRMSVVANNVANANTDEFVPDRVDSAAAPGGGVQSTVRGGMRVMADSSVLLSGKLPSQTDYATEGVNLVLARRSYEANARAWKAHVDSERRMMDAFG